MIARFAALLTLLAAPTAALAQVMAHHQHHGGGVAAVDEQVELFGQQGSRLWVLIFEVAHDSEHYGNPVTYLREKGQVPPSSQGGM